MITADKVVATIEAVFSAVRDLPASVSVERRMIGEFERLILTRQLADGARRYMRITATPQDNHFPQGIYGVLGGSYGAPGGRGFDGRRYGDLAYVTRVIRMWLVDLADWEDLPLWQPPA